MTAEILILVPDEWCETDPSEPLDPRLQPIMDAMDRAGYMLIDFGECCVKYQNAPERTLSEIWFMPKPGDGHG